MKYIKLFEQFEDEDEENSWWKEESKFDEKELIIVQLRINGFYYLAKIVGDDVVRFNNEPFPSPIESYNYPVLPYRTDRIHIYDRDNEFEGNVGYYPWKYFYYGDISQKLKNKLKEI